MAYSAMASPEKYREEASKLREEAYANSDADVRATILQIARLHERLAERVAEHAKTQASS
jgi:hypothetical protein